MLEKVKEIALRAGDMMLQGFDEIQEKSDVSNIVTNKDVEIQKYIIAQLKKMLPQSSFLAEESESYQEEDGYQWIIDPIDGTTNFAYDRHHSAVSIALMKDHQIIIGVCYDPYLKELFYAEKGKGAFLNDKALHVSRAPLSSGLIVCGTSPYYKEHADVTFDNMKKLFLHGRDIRRGGSAVLDICYLAAGREDGYYEEVLSPWDYAAASLILSEAGGHMHVINGEWGFHAPLGMIAGNETIVEEMRQLLHR